jgi:hypothetical protein
MDKQLNMYNQLNMYTEVSLIHLYQHQNQLLMLSHMTNQILKIYTN